MRQIKFRAWENQLGRNRMFAWEEIKKDFESWLNVSDTYVMQYTGLNDKNGNEIYEGDIVKFNGYNCKVIWQFNSCEWMLQQIDTEYKAYMNFEYRYQSDYKIIGNIHENKNLLQ